MNRKKLSLSLLLLATVLTSNANALTVATDPDLVWISEDIPHNESLNRYLEVAINRCGGDKKAILSEHINPITLLVTSSSMVRGNENPELFEKDFSEYLIQNMDCEHPGKASFHSMSDSDLHEKYPLTMDSVLHIGSTLICDKQASEQKAIPFKTYVCR